MLPTLTYTIGQEVALTLPRATALDVDGMLTYTYTLMPTEAIDGLTFAPETRTLAGTPTTETNEAETLTYTATDDDTEGMASLTFTVTIVSDVVTPAVTFTSTLAPHLTYTVGQEVALTLPRATALDVDGMLTYTYTLMPTEAIDGLTFAPETRTLAGTPTTETNEAETLTYTATDDDTEGMASLTFTVTIVSEVDTTATTRLNEQILSRATSAMTAGTLAAVAARVEAAADGSGGSGKPVAFQLDGRSSLRRTAGEEWQGDVGRSDGLSTLAGWCVLCVAVVCH